ncbi:MAG: SWIM zinc finger family protein [Anaerolineae bacterium]|nr:SWIM zinc finger family protein [Anaerolineae bacterium]
MFTFTEEDIRNLTTGQSFTRGQRYYRDGAVSDLVLRGNRLTAQVTGSSYEPYQVCVNLNQDGKIESASCTCLYEWGGFCKHIVAVLLAALHDSQIEIRPSLETLLSDLTADQLRRLMLVMAEEHPELVETIEEEVEGLKMQPTPAALPTSLNLNAISRAMRKAFHDASKLASARGNRYDYGDYWYDDEFSVIYPDDILNPHLELARQLLDAGDADAATQVIETVIEEWVKGVKKLDDWIREVNEDVFIEAGRKLAVLLAEALLSQDLSPEERKARLRTIQAWEDELIAVEVVQTALEQWWDDPSLTAVLRGKITNKGVWKGEPPDFADELALARLRILERQNRLQEYLYLAEAEGQLNLYVNMLARTGQVAEAIKEAQAHLTQPDEFHELAQILAKQGQQAAAMQVAVQGLKRGEQWLRRELAHWLVQQAESAGDMALALHGAEAAFLASYELNDYKLVQRLAGDRWPEVRERLLKHLKSVGGDQAVAIYLHERMLPQAMAAVERNSYSHYLDQVVEAASADYPDWSVRQCQKQAERIMNAGDAGHYDDAVNWLRRAKEIYLQHQRADEWTAYLDDVLKKHARKYKLVPMLHKL